MLEHSLLFTIYRFYVRLSQKTRLIDYIGIVSKSAGSMLKNNHYRRNCCHRKCSPAPYSPYVILMKRHLFLHISHMRLNSNAFQLDSAIPNATRVHQCNNIFYGLLFTFAHFLGFNFCKSTNELHFIVSRFMLMANKQIPNHLKRLRWIASEIDVIESHSMRGSVLMVMFYADEW